MSFSEATCQIVFSIFAPLPNWLKNIERDNSSIDRSVEAFFERSRFLQHHELSSRVDMSIS